jgi:siroheme synthase (precorrin-2 oxidase/ferrochelatase)
MSSSPPISSLMRYPLFLDLASQRVVVIGAGRVAARKTRTLLAADAVVTVICPNAGV